MSTASTFEREMLALVNEERTSRGLNPLQLETQLNASSEDHSTWMLDRDIFSHTGAGGSSATDRMRDAGLDLSGSWRTGENIAWQSERGAPGISDDVAQLHQSLMNSPGHRANILNPDFEYIGIGIEAGDMRGFDAVMVTQNFAATDAEVSLDTGQTPPPPVEEDIVEPDEPVAEPEDPDTDTAETEDPETPDTDVTETEDPETPDADVTETDTPEQDTPDTDMAETEDPQPETPDTDVTEPEDPETPDTDVTETEDPDVDVTDTDDPAPDMPDACVTEADEPEQDTPETDVTDTDAPEMPDTDVTDTDTPEPETPETDITDADTPDTESPEPDVAETDDPADGCFDVAAFIAELEAFIDALQARFDQFAWNEDQMTSEQDDFDLVMMDEQDPAEEEPTCTDVTNDESGDTFVINFYGFDCMMDAA